MAVIDHIFPDSPTNTFATLNPLVVSTSTLSDGNLKAQQTNAEYGLFRSTISIPKTGKYYVECFILSSVSTGDNQQFGIVDSKTDKLFVYDFYYTGNGLISSDGVTSTPSTGALVAGQIIAILIDADSGSANFYIDNNILSSPTYSLTSTTDYFVYFNGFSSGVSVYNFGQDHTFGGYPNSLASSSGYSDAYGIGKFYYDPPTGALALCTANLPDPDIDPNVDDLPEDYFKAVLYPGNSSTQSITSVGFQPDLVWCKNRTVSGSNHRLFDSVRGASSVLFPSLTSDAATDSTGLTSFDSTGFSIGATQVNDTGANFVAWCFRAGGNDSTYNWGDGTGSSTYSGIQSALSLPASSTSGMITPSGMSVNQKAGFSIVKYNGNNGGGDVPHGLSKKPDFLIVRPLTTTSDWIVWHKDLGNNFNDGYIYFNLTTQSGTVTNYWGSNGINNNTFGLYAGHQLAGNNNTNAGTSPYPHIAYCWHSVDGYSAFGSYTGNGSADGPFVYTGFKPAWVMVKNISTSGSGHSSWMIFDSARQPYNTSPANNRLEADTANAEDGDGRTGSGGNGIDMLSNGFKVRAGNWYDTNYSGSTYIFAAFAEQPFKYANAR